ncbi:MAG: alanine racemase [Verrucomicrobiota bacterium]
MNRPSGIEDIPSPGLLFDLDAVDRNLDRMLAEVGNDPARLRPHMKTHKCAEILQRQKKRGIDTVKCATLAEAELAASVGVGEILVAYPLVGPNVKLIIQLAARWKGTSRFAVAVDNTSSLRRLEETAPAGLLDVFLDLDIGMHRTGISRACGARALVTDLAASKTLRFAGVHAYDGHIHTPDLETRRSEFEEAIGELDQFLDELSSAGVECPQVISGGSPTFPFHAKRAVEASFPWQCSPGTPLLWDAGYSEHHPDLSFEPAAFLLTRVISHPGPDLACLDLGHKAVSAENPITHRVRFPDFEKVEFVSQSEEHLVVRFPSGARPEIGEEILGIPYHVCPSVALYDEAYSISENSWTGKTIPIAARSRRVEKVEA